MYPLELTKPLTSPLPIEAEAIGFHYPWVDSTNEVAKTLIQTGDLPPLSYVTAHGQTAGKGTQGRVWVSPPGAGIYLSVIHLNPPIQAITTDFTLAAGVACAQVLENLTGLTIGLKPVNDLYIDNRKLGGILVEGLVVGSHLRGVVTGIGINRNNAPRALPANAVQPISLEDVLSPPQLSKLHPQEVLDCLVGAIDFWYGLIWTGRTAQIQRAWDHLKIML